MNRTLTICLAFINLYRSKSVNVFLWKKQQTTTTETISSKRRFAIINVRRRSSIAQWLRRKTGNLETCVRFPETATGPHSLAGLTNYSIFLEGQRQSSDGEEMGIAVITLANWNLSFTETWLALGLPLPRNGSKQHYQPVYLVEEWEYWPLTSSTGCPNLGR